MAKNEETSERDEWRLESIKVEFCGWGENKGKYVGKVSFRNGEQESFSFNIRPNMADKYIDLIAVDLVRAASTLGDRLIKSLDLDPQEVSDE